MRLSIWLMVAFLQQKTKVAECSIALSSSSRSSFKSTRSMSRYDKDPRCFSPEGEILQLTYADRAGSNGQSLVCLVTTEGAIVLVCPREPESSRMLDHRAVDKVSRVDDGIWIASAGLLGDSRQLVRQARNYCINYRARYGVRPSVKNVAHHMGSLQHDASLAGGLRPFGVHLLTAGFEEKYDAVGVSVTTPAVYLSRASGEVTQWHAVAIGKSSVKMLQLLEDTVYVDDISALGEAAAVNAAVNILGKVSTRRSMRDSSEGQASPAVPPNHSHASSSDSGSDESTKRLDTKQVGDDDEEKPTTYNIYTLRTDNKLEMTTKLAL